MISANAPKPKKYLRTVAVVILFAVPVLAAVVLIYSMFGWSVPANAKKLRNPVPPSEAAIASAEISYMDHCMICHGQNGDGKSERAEKLSVAPTDFTDAHAMNLVTDGELFWKISHGRRPMPAFQDKLTETERWQLVDFIRTFAQKPNGAAAAPSSHSNTPTQPK